ncbi:APC family permease [Galactobacter valiniphilus]|nr:amino acid permease [Galactobacter valiniphilus]
MSAQENGAQQVHEDDDAAHLASLGYDYDPAFKREMTFWGNVSLGFTYLSPVVGIYSLFAMSLGYGGPPMIWALVIVGFGQWLVACVFGEVVSNYPVAGGVYPWSRRLWGRKWGWMNGWIYLVALLVTIASVSYGAGTYIAPLLGLEATPGITVTCAIALIILATLLNLRGTKLLSVVAMIGLLAELGGAIVVGVWLLIFSRHHDLSILFNSFGAGEGKPYFFAFAAAALIGIYMYYGFEACGDVAEEIKNPGVRVPKAMRMTIYIGGAAGFFITLSLLMATPDIGAVVRGEVADPVSEILSAGFGPVGYKIVLIVVLISFVSCVLSLQAAASRLAYSMARDGILPGSAALARISSVRHVPVVALLVAGVVPILVVLLSLASADALTYIISFAALGMYMGFHMVVLAALRARLKGWKPAGKFAMGAWGLPVNILALAWGILGMINMVVPHSPTGVWVTDWITLLSALAVVAIGLVYMVIAKPYLKGNAPAGDAIPAAARA